MNIKCNIFIFSIIIIFSSGSFSDSWNIETVDGDGIVGKDCSLALDSNDYPHISYFDYTNSDLKYARWDGTTWQIETVHSIGYVGWHTSIALDSEDHPHISYFKSDTEDLRYAYFDGTNWHREAVDIDDYVGTHTSIAVDSTNFPHISYYGSLKYATWDGVIWQIEIVAHPGTQMSIALDSNDNPHISYHNSSTEDLGYAYWDGFTWKIYTVDYEFDVGAFSSIAIDSQDNPHISYQNDYYSQLKYAFLDGSGWVFEVVDDKPFPIIAAFGTSLALDVSDHPNIAYCNVIDWNVAELNFAHFDGSNWYIETIDNGDVGYSPSLAFDSNGYPHIAYHDNWNGDLKYAWADSIPAINLTTFSANAKGDSAIILNWSVEATEGEVIDGFNLYRREVGLTDETLTPGSEDTHPRIDTDTDTWHKINSHLITGDNPYSYIDDTVESGNTYEYKLEAVIEETPQTIGTTQGTCGLPTSFAITSIHPNPTTDSVSITLSTPEPTDVMIEVYDITGRLVMTREIGEIESGEYSTVMDTSTLMSGVYTVKAKSDVETSTKRMVIVR